MKAQRPPIDVLTHWYTPDSELRFMATNSAMIRVNGTKYRIVARKNAGADARPIATLLLMTFLILKTADTVMVSSANWPMRARVSEDMGRITFLTG